MLLRFNKNGAAITLSGNGTTINSCTYTPRAPNLSDNAIIELLRNRDWAALARVRVTESATVILEGTPGQILTQHRAIEAVYPYRRARNDTERLFIEYRVESSGDIYRSEIYGGRVEPVERSINRQIESGVLEVVVMWEREFCWNGPEAEAQLWNGAAGFVTGGLPIFNWHDNGTHVNYADIASSDIDGVLPADCRIVFRNEAGTDVDWANLYIGHNRSAGHDAFAHILEGEDNEAVSGSVSGSVSGTHTFSDDQVTLVDSTKSWTTNQWVGYTVRNLTDGSSGVITSNTATNVSCSGGLSGGTDDDWDTDDDYVISNPALSNGFFYSRTWTGAMTHATALYEWTISGSQLVLANGDWFRVLARFASSPNSTTRVKVGLYHQVLHKLYETPEMKLDSTLQLQDLGAIPLPPALSGLSNMGDITLRITARDVVSGSLSIDFIQLTPLDSWRHLETLGGTYADGSEIVDDGLLDLLYIDEGGTDKYANVVAEGGRVLLWPGRDQRLIFLFDEASDMDIARESEVEIHYRPRRTTL